MLQTRRRSEEETRGATRVRARRRRVRRVQFKASWDERKSATASVNRCSPCARRGQRTYVARGQPRVTTASMEDTRAKSCFQRVARGVAVTILVVWFCGCCGGVAAAKRDLRSANAALVRARMRRAGTLQLGRNGVRTTPGEKSRPYTLEYCMAGWQNDSSLLSQRRWKARWQLRLLDYRCQWGIIRSFFTSESSSFEANLTFQTRAFQAVDSYQRMIVLNQARTLSRCRVVL
ncbi:hypothetical protein BU23DRAFT_3542 [Bimuria novae-zelandiae CBS 107.79]|uniref:Uncharacterized protein n=1 Tax=Bimuria novae-zelandiae CBS 107.79 TaxID=1447943 RepID=A0A6A5VTV4_9PLEO|nr:hypothetical protein BU23DRAFT_3542 [Bimuria novae-zelandiae CBS 107.79]